MDKGDRQRARRGRAAASEDRTFLIKVARPELSLIEYDAGPNYAGASPHYHERHTDAFYVLEGELEFTIGRETDPRPGRDGGRRAARGRPRLHERERRPGPLPQRPRSRRRLRRLHPRRRPRRARHVRQRRRRRAAGARRRHRPRPRRGTTYEVGTATSLFKATRGATAGFFSLAEVTIQPGTSGPPPHSHRELLDSFYVLEGTLTVQVGDDEVDAPPGTYACVPPGIVHTFANRSAEPVRFLNLNTPGGWEDYIRDLAAATPADGPPDPRLMGEVLARHDLVIRQPRRSAGTTRRSPRPGRPRRSARSRAAPRSSAAPPAPPSTSGRPPATPPAAAATRTRSTAAGTPVLAGHERRARLVQSSRGTRMARVSGMRDHGATSTTVQTASSPTAARACRSPTRRRSRSRLPRGRTSSACVPTDSVSSPSSSRSSAVGAGSSASFGRQREPKAVGLRRRLAQRQRAPPGAAADELRREGELPRGPAGPLRAGEQALDERRQRPRERQLVRHRLREGERLRDLGRRPARLDRGAPFAPGEPPRPPRRPRRAGPRPPPPAAAPARRAA